MGLMLTVHASIAATSSVRIELECPNLIAILTAQSSTRFIVVFHFYWYIFWLRIKKEELLQSDFGYSKQVPILLWSYHVCDLRIWPSVENASSPTTLGSHLKPHLGEFRCRGAHTLRFCRCLWTPNTLVSELAYIVPLAYVIYCFVASSWTLYSCITYISQSTCHVCKCPLLYSYFALVWPCRCSW